MKIVRALLALSVTANLALGAWLLWSNGEAKPIATTPASERATIRSAGAPAPAALTAEAWRELNSDKDAEFVANLRANGFPTSMVYALTNARVRARHAEALARFRPPADFAYWSESPLVNDPPMEERPARRALERQIAAELKNLLGRDSDRSTIYQRRNRERLYGPISEEKADAISELNKDYGEITGLVRDRSKGILLQADRDQLAIIEREKRADLARILTPAELLEYDLRASPSAATVRHQLRNLDATEEEFRELAALQLAFDQKYGVANLSGEQQQRRALAQPTLTEQIKAALSPERYAEYQIKTDQTYPYIAMLITQNRVAIDPARVVSTQRGFAERFNELRGNGALSPAERNAQLDALSAEANRVMAAALGPDAFKSYKASGGPINALLNRPAPASR